MLIRLLGEISAGADEETLIVPGGRVPAAVLAHLALAGGRVVLTEALIASVWDRPTPTARNAVQVAVSRLRKLYGADLVDGSRTGYRLRAALVRVDWYEAEQLLAQARSSLTSEQFAAALESAQAASALFAGEPLAGLDSRAAAAARQHAVATRSSASLVIARSLLHLGRADESIDAARPEADRDPLNEPAAALLMEALARAGRPAEALTAYDALRRRLRDELGTDPSVPVARLFAGILAGDVAVAVAVEDRAASIAAPPRVVLPAQGTPLRGRDQEVNRVAELIRGGYRLVTLVGPGGIGKTRLAVEVARGLAAEDGRAAVFVDLTLARAADDVLATVASALDSEPGSLAEELRGTGMLLVLDNAEHLLDSVSHLATTLLAVDGVSLLVTSRSPLRLHQERTVDVEGLGTAGPESPAVLLLADRAGLTGAEVTAYSPALVTLARQLDGVPLVLELLASALQWRTPDEALLDVAQTLTEASDESRDRLERHSSVAAALRWSLERASDDARRGLSALVVLRGGFDEAAASAILASVAGDAGPRAILADLVDLSLVKRLREPGHVRFRLLEPIRLFVAGSLLAGSPPAPVHAAHARHYFTLLAQAHLRFGETSNVFDDLIRFEDANLTQALTWSWGHEPALAMEHLADLMYGWLRRNRDPEIEVWSARALASPYGSPGQRARLIVVRLRVLLERPDVDPAETSRLSAAAQPLADEFDDEWHRRWVTAQAELARMHGDLEGALAWTDQYRLGTELARSQARQQRAAILADLGRWAEAYDEAAAGLTEASTDHHREARVFALSGVAYLAVVAGKHEQARALLEEAMELAVASGTVLGRIAVENNLGWLSLATGEPERALGWAARLLGEAAAWTDPPSLIEAFIIAGLALLERGGAEPAGRVAAGAARQAREAPGLLDPYVASGLDRLVRGVGGEASTTTTPDVTVDEVIRVIRAAAH